MSNWSRVKSQIAGAKAATVAPSATAYLKSMASYAAALESEVGVAENNNAIVELPRLEQEVKDLWIRIEAKDNGAGFNLSAGQLSSALIVAVVLGGIAVMLWTFVSNAAPGALSTIDGVRPIITLAAIISTVGFGASLVLAALFSSDANFETRFRTAREIFLVFSGVFATVVGFHFGAGQAASVAPLPAISVVKMAKTGDKLYITIEGGSPPYKVEADLGGTKKAGEGASPVAIDLGKDFDSSKALAQVLIKVTDKSKGSQNLPLTNITLDKGWERPQVPNSP